MNQNGTKQVNFRFESECVEMLEKLVEHYSIGGYLKYSKTSVMQMLIERDYREKFHNAGGENREG